MAELPRKSVARTAKLAALPLGYAGRTALGLGKRLGGASAETVNNTVVRPILQQMSGLDHLEYLSAQSYANGSMEIDLTFAQGTNPDIAQVQVQNKLQLAEARLPTEVTTEEGYFFTPSRASSPSTGQPVPDSKPKPIFGPCSTRVTARLE